MDLKPRITVVGIGGAGCNAINNMIATRLDGVEFVVANTDAQSLGMSNAERRIQLGTNLTEGLGAGARPEVGEAAAREAEEDIRAELAGSHMVFIAAGMGGGTGTGAASVIAEIGRDLGILTVGIVSKPFQFEGARRMRTADAGIDALEKVVDTLIVIPNQNLFRIANERTTFAEAFRLADQVLYSGIACIVDLIVKEGLINLDFADVQAVMKGMGTAMMGTGEASGDDRAMTAANEAIANPLLDNISLGGASGLLISIVGGTDLTLYEVDTAASHIRKEVAADANIIVGATTEEGMEDRIRVSIVAAGIDGTRPAAQFEPAVTAPAPASVAPAFVAPDSPPDDEPALSYAQEATSESAPSQPPRAPAPIEASGDEGRKGPEEVAPKEMPSGAKAADEMNETEADEFARALSQAMESAADEGSGASPDAWRSPDGVVVEEGFAKPRGESPSPPPLPTGRSKPADEAAAFDPAPPVVVRRSAPRMPDVSEFPEVAQREYFARMEEATNTDKARTPAPAPERREAGLDQSARPPGPSAVERAAARAREAKAESSDAAPQPRQGLLRRLTGTGRR